MAKRRDRYAENILGDLRGVSVIVIGIGGGGDIIGAIPTYCELLRLGANPILAGLSWKRSAHDPAARPRAISEFANIDAFDDVIGIVNANTSIRGGEIQHVEADASAMLNGLVLTIDITGGVAKVRASLLNFMKTYEIGKVVAIDVGGDVLCTGYEPTLRSPLCDQILLKVISSIDGAILGVAGLGADGELLLDRFLDLFPQLISSNAYIGALAAQTSDHDLLRNLLKTEKSECSRCVLEIACETRPEELEQAECDLNKAQPKIERYLANYRQKSLRSGRRCGELSILTAMTLFFDPSRILAASVFSRLIRDEFDLSEVTVALRAANILTEFDQQNS